MKKLLKVSALSVLLVLVFALTVFAAQTGKVTADAIRIRKQPNTTSDILEVVDKDEKVTIVEDKGEWVKVSYKDVEGYCMKKYLKISGTADTNTKTTTTNTAKTETTTTETQTPAQPKTVVTEVGSLDTISVNTSIELSSDAKLRVLPNFMSSIIDTFPAGTQVKVINKMGSWLQVSNDVKTGWINGTRAVVKIEVVEEKPVEEPVEEIKAEEPAKEEPKVEEKKAEETKKEETTSNCSEYKKQEGRVNVPTARVREKPNTNSEIVGTLDYNEKVTIDNETGEWYHLKSGNVTGYVRKDLISTGVSSRGLEERREDTQAAQTQEVQAAAPAPAPAASANGAAVVAFAKNYIGYPYVAAGKNPNSGFDCSGFTQYVFSNFGVSLGGSAASQSGAGTEVSRDQLAPGDLLLFLDEGRSMIGHTGIYIGGNQMVHAANPKRGVVIDYINEANSYYNTRFVTARRLVN